MELSIIGDGPLISNGFDTLESLRVFLPMRSTSTNPSPITYVAGAILVIGMTMALVHLAASAEDGQRSHIRIETPGELTPEEARRAYEMVTPRMKAGYEFSGQAVAREYREWRRYNAAPYLSATHGNRYVNNYGNQLAAGYEHVSIGTALPEGAIVAKDSFTVTDEGEVLPAPLFVMEKLESGSSPETGDWRYLMLLPDGSVYGDSQGAASDRTQFCHSCHLDVAHSDYLFFVPEPHRSQ